MLKRIGALALMLVMLASSAAVAEVTNRDMQLLGGVLVSNANDSFFFCPMEEGVSRHWGLYSVSGCANGPILEINDGVPARLVHADAEKVYFMGYTDPSRTVHELHSVNIADGTTEELLTGIQNAFVEDSESFFYVTEEKPGVLMRYSIANKKSTEIKDMSKNDKKIYDAIPGQDAGDIYFLTMTTNGAQDGYWYHASSKKATNLDKPNPASHLGFLYEGYRVYSIDMGQSAIYSQKIGTKKGVQIGKDGPSVYTYSPRFGEFLYAYDGDSNTLVAYPLDGSDRKTLTLEGGIINRILMGGSKDEVLFYSGDAIYGAPANLSSQSKLIDFDLSTGGQMWTHIAPAGSKAIVMFGYGSDTLTYQDTMPPTGVYVFDRATGEQLFGFPEYDAEAAAATPVSTQMPETIGAPEPERKEGETYFVF